MAFTPSLEHFCYRDVFSDVAGPTLMRNAEPTFTDMLARAAVWLMKALLICEQHQSAPRLNSLAFVDFFVLKKQFCYISVLQVSNILIYKDCFK